MFCYILLGVLQVKVIYTFGKSLAHVRVERRYGKGGRGIEDLSFLWTFYKRHALSRNNNTGI